MTQANTPAGAIVVGVDGSEQAAAALRWAATEADLTGRPLAIVHAITLPTTNQKVWLTSGGVSPDFVIDEERKDAAVLLADAAHESSESHPHLVITTHCREADPRIALIEEAAHAHMVVLGSRGRGPVRSLLLGSVSLAVSRHAPRPVVVIRPSTPDLPRRGVLVGTAVGDGPSSTLETAFREASLRRTPLTVLHCRWDGDPSTGKWVPLPAGTPEHVQNHAVVAAAIAGLREKYPDVNAEIMVARGAADRCLVDIATTHELVVVGRHGASPLDFTGFGSVSATVTEHARTSVMVVP